MVKEYYRIIYIVLVYKNVEVTEDFYNSLAGLKNYKVVIVNSFYDEISNNKCREMALKHCSDFISVANKGYGAGNNRGIDFVLDNYEFDYLVISNSDIKIVDINYLYENIHSNAILSPNTVMRTGRKQNPCCPYKLKSYMYFLSKGFQYNNHRIARFAHICNRFAIWIFELYSLLIHKDLYSIFMGHGSFVVFGKNALKKLYPVYNEKMFLYNEELYLGLKCQKFKIPIYYVPSMKVFHEEGASAGDVYSKQFHYYRDSFFELLKDDIAKYE